MSSERAYDSDGEHVKLQGGVHLATPSTIQHHFRKLKDPRLNRRKLHSLLDILFIALCAVLCGAQDWQQVEFFGKKRLTWLRRFLKLPNGVPSHDTFERVFDRLDPIAFQPCLQMWVADIADTALVESQFVAKRARLFVYLLDGGRAGAVDGEVAQEIRFVDQVRFADDAKENAMLILLFQISRGLGR